MMMTSTFTYCTKPPSTPKPTVAVIVGSLRRGSLNRKLANSICAMAAPKLDCRFAEIDQLPLYNEDFDDDPPAPYVAFRTQIAATDAVLFCTPEYNRGLPGPLKNALDVASRPYGQSVWDRKLAAVISASPGRIGGFAANHQLRQCCVFLNMPVMPQPEAYLSGLRDDVFDESGQLKEGPLRDFTASFTSAFREWIYLMAGSHMARALA